MSTLYNINMDIQLLSPTQQLTEEQEKKARVSNILSYCEQFEKSDAFIAYKKKKALDDKDKTEEEKATQIIASTLGTYVHFCLDLAADNKDFISYIEDKIPDHYKREVYNRIDLYKPFLALYQPLLHECSFVASNVEGKYSYRGTLDGLGLVDKSQIVNIDNKQIIENERVLIDFKNYQSSKPNIFLVRPQVQLAAYSYGLSTTSEYRVDNCMLITTSPKTLALWYMNQDKLKFFLKEWLNCLQYYYNKWNYNWDDLKERVGIDNYMLKATNMCMERVYPINELRKKHKYIASFQDYLNPRKKTFNRDKLGITLNTLKANTSKYLKDEQLKILHLLDTKINDRNSDLELYVTKILECDFE